MTAETEELREMLEAKYLKKLYQELHAWQNELGTTAEPMSIDTAARLFTRYASFPTFVSWERQMLQQETGSLPQPTEAMKPLPTTETPEDKAKRFFNEAKNYKLSRSVWQGLNEWRKKNSDRTAVGGLSYEELLRAVKEGAA